ncbi:PadR family transcriptional regulator [Thermococcus chitonophagus]|uniref:Transcriptional regulator, PadR family n=1 Tax=Thermococcus chitonophagus TaxID=54262 RepID=A0A170STN8_9EURY|nr:helix-turn-helix transcriptional regulator [Thermococcus chitonophagus]CUX78693.1 Transcriptional regulator, PadR family [Thermococcus chitonophagus]
MKAVEKLRKELRAGLYSYLVLLILEREGELHGYGIRKKLEELTNGRLVPSEGTLYDLLKSLKKHKLIEDRLVLIGKRPRRYYRITSQGRDVLEELREEVREIIGILEVVT